MPTPAPVAPRHPCDHAGKGTQGALTEERAQDAGANAGAGLVESWNRPWIGREPGNLLTRHHHDLDHLDFGHDLNEHPDHQRTALIRLTTGTAHSMVRGGHGSLDQTSTRQGSRLSRLNGPRCCGADPNGLPSGLYHRSPEERCCRHHHPSRYLALFQRFSNAVWRSTTRLQPINNRLATVSLGKRRLALPDPSWSTVALTTAPGSDPARMGVSGWPICRARR